jgi:hypothetical protein
MFIDFINFFHDPSAFLKSLPLEGFFIVPHVTTVVYLIALYVAFKIPFVQKLASAKFAFFMYAMYLIYAGVAMCLWGSYSRGVLEYHGAIPDSFAIVLGYTLWYATSFGGMIIGVIIQTMIILRHTYEDPEGSE